MNLFYNLPQNLIAQIPAEKRDEARLLVLSRSNGEITHMIFKSLVDFLDESHLLVLNNTRVFPARLFGKNEGGGKVEVLLVRESEPLVWEVLGRPAKRLKKGQIINFDHGNFQAEVLEDGKKKLVKFSFPNHTQSFPDLFFKYGRTPLPPYIKRPCRDVSLVERSCCEEGEKFDRVRYQTVYAKSIGSCACPTAGLHFTPEILNALKNKGVGIVEITLHVGPGTFRPIKKDNPEEHIMEKEFFAIFEEAVSAINSAKKKGLSIVAVGTSTVRALEQAGASGEVSPGEGNANIFIKPGYRFKIVNSLITNFHQPNSTPLALVSAFAGEGFITKAYNEAVKKKYRFLSYGDSMFII